ncbi:MAG: hypothetical protein RLZZ58_1470 [Pseudomonadota bacterium]
MGRQGQESEMHMTSDGQIRVLPRTATGGAVIVLTAAAGLLALGSSALAASKPDGAVLFKQRCAQCHQVAAGKVSPLGPNLAGIVGRKAAAATFNYSAALKGSNLVWTRANLDKYLTAPAKMVPGTRMAVTMPDAAQRGAVLDYLAKQR